MLGVLGEVFGDHLERALEHGPEDVGDAREEQAAEAGDDGRQHVEHLGVARGGQVGLVVGQDGLEQRRDEGRVELLDVLALADVAAYRQRRKGQRRTDVSTSLRISFLIVRRPRTLGVLVATRPCCATVSEMIEDTAL